MQGNVVKSAWGGIKLELIIRSHVKSISKYVSEILWTFLRIFGFEHTLFKLNFKLETFI